MVAEDFKTELQKHANADDAVFLQRFFKTGKGEYGEGDVFIGVRVPATRQVCKTFKGLSLKEVQKLLDSPVHEHRLAAVIILTLQFPKASEQQKRAIYDLYLRNVAKKRINNWDIIDLSAKQIVGSFLEDRDKKILIKLAKSDNIWERRTAILSTFYYIRPGGNPGTTIQIAEILLHDRHDLIQKATGWALREAGKRVDESVLTKFLDKHVHEMPRTMLRYAIERLSDSQKTQYMKQT